MAEKKSHFVVYKVTGKSRKKLGKCWADRPSRCLRKIAFKDAPLNTEMTVDVEEARSGKADRAIKRYRARSALVATNPDKRRFKEQYGIGNPDKETKVEILSTEQFVRRGDTITSARKVKSKSPKRSARQKVSSNTADINGYAFRLASSTPSIVTYEATLNTQPLSWADGLSALQESPSSLGTALHKIITKVTKTFGNKEVAFRATLPDQESNFTIRFSELPSTKAKPSRAAYARLPANRVSKLANNIQRITGANTESVTLVPQEISTPTRFGSIGQFFSSETAQSRALLRYLAEEVESRAAEQVPVEIKASSQPGPWVQFQVQ